MIWLVLSVLVLAVGLFLWKRPADWRETLVGALITLPLLVWISPTPESVSSLVVGGAAASVMYKLVLHRLLTPVIHPHRAMLAWCALGLPSAAAAYYLLDLRALHALLIGLAVELIIVPSVRAILVWDSLAAMAGMGLLYGLLFLGIGESLHARGIPAGPYIAGLPIQHLMLVALFGALFGPLYASFRSLQEHETPFLPRHHLPKQIVFILVIGCTLTAVSWVQVRFMQVPKVIASTPRDQERITQLTDPLVIQLDRPVAREAVQVTLKPEIAGEISFEDPYLQRDFVRRIIFTPTTYFEPNTRYEVVISDLRNVLGTQSTSYTYSFRTPLLPAVASTTPATTSTQVDICAPFSVTLDAPTGKLAEFSFELSPAVDLDVTQSEDAKGYVIKPQECLAQSQNYTLTTRRRLLLYGSDGTLLSTSEPDVVYTASFTTKGAPGISAMTPQGGGVLASQRTLSLTFSEEMRAETLADYIKIAPALSGSWSWVDTRTARFVAAADLPLNTHYAVEVTPGMHDVRGGYITEKASFNFSTVGHVRLSSSSPANHAAGVALQTPISLTFDQPVDHASAESRFSISPEAPGTFSWKGDTTLVYTAELVADTTYTVTVAAGVVSQIGLELAESVKRSFQTIESVTLLSVPLYYQERALSCEIASLRMALAFRGVQISETNLFNSIPNDSSPRNGGTWADPDLVFVGDVNGRQNTTGYGVHAIPIAAAGAPYRTTEVISGWSMSQLAETLQQGNPVVFWGIAGSGKPDQWTTPAGKTISTYVGEHVRVIIGFTGSVKNPTKFIINDPIYGRLRWTSAQLQENWGKFGGLGVAIF